MGGWLMGIVGVVAIGVLLDILLPSGEINKYIKGIFGIVVVFVIVAPLPKLLKGDGFGIFEKIEDMNYDKEYVEKINDERNEMREGETLAKLSKIADVNKVSITYSDSDYYSISGVTITIPERSLDKTDLLRAEACKVLGLKAKDVKIIKK